MFGKQSHDGIGKSQYPQIVCETSFEEQPPKVVRVYYLLQEDGTKIALEPQPLLTLADALDNLKIVLIETLKALGK